MRKHTLFFVLLVAVVLAGCAAAILPGTLAPNACASSAQAGILNTSIEGGQETVTVSYREFCKPPAIVAIGSESVERIQLGVVTPKTATFILHGADGPAVVHWQVMPVTNK